MIQRLKAEFETKELFRIGRKAENEVEQFDFDFTTWQEKYGEGSAVLLVQRNRDDSAYPVPLIIENGIASWVITDTDTAKSGRGTFQLEYVSETKKKKSDVWHFVCGISLEGTLPAPDPYENWLETITEKTAEVSGYAQNAQQSAQDAYQSAEDAEASAVSAQSSADNANQSAIDAENSAVAAETAQGKAETAQAAAQSALAGMTFVSFSIDADGHVLITNSDLLGTTEFELTESGHMEVTY